MFNLSLCSLQKTKELRKNSLLIYFYVFDQLLHIHSNYITGRARIVHLNKLLIFNIGKFYAEKFIVPLTNLIIQILFTYVYIFLSLIKFYLIYLFNINFNRLYFILSFFFIRTIYRVINFETSCIKFHTFNRILSTMIS